MSDRYRPPSGPKSTRPYKGQNSYNNLSRSSNPTRYNERDNYRPKIHGPPTKEDRLGPSSDSRPTGPSGRPTGPSGRPTGPSGRPTGPSARPTGPLNGKRNYPDSNRGPPEKRRDFHKPLYNGKEKVNMANVPKGPKSGPRDFVRGPKPPTRPPPKNARPPPRPAVLRKNQLFSILSVRPSEVYRRVQQVGEGTYGKVYKATSTITNEFVALKKLRLESEREGFPITAIREIKLLQSFQHENILGLLEMMVEHNQIYMVLEYLDHDLTGLLTHPELKLTEGNRKYLFKQLMEGLNYLHKKRVIHRDIKGSNILLDSKGTVKIADFGLARTMKIINTGESPDYTNRVITIWYRPPELLLGATDYGREVDIWGVGCLLIELYCKVAAFQGTEEISQLYKIFDLMGTPTIESWPRIENLPWFEMLKPKVNKGSRFASQYKAKMSDDSFDLAEKLLCLNPAKRLTASKALQHDYFTKEPLPQPLDLHMIKGEWHEFETKKIRRQERKRLQDAQKAAAAAASSVNTASIPATTSVSPDVEMRDREIERETEIRQEEKEAKEINEKELKETERRVMPMAVDEPNADIEPVQSGEPGEPAQSEVPSEPKLESAPENSEPTEPTPDSEPQPDLV